MEINRYRAILRHWWWLILLGTILAALAAYVTSKLERPVYQANTLLLIQQGTQTTASDTYTSILVSQSQASTFATLITNKQVLAESFKRLNIDISYTNSGGIRGYSITATSSPNAPFITLKVESTDPSLAASIANMIVQVFMEQNAAMQTNRYTVAMNNLAGEMDKLSASIQSTQAEITALGTPTTSQDSSDLQNLQNQLAQYQQSYANMSQSYETLRIAETESISGVVQISPASVPLAPIRPRTMLNTIIAGLLGFMLVIGAIFLIEYIDDTIKTPEEAVAKLHIPVIGIIAQIKNQTEDVPYVFANPRSQITEAFRTLRTNIQFAAVGKPIQTILVTSAAPGEGKTSVATSLAIVMAQGGKQVILADFDLRRPNIHKQMGVSNREGLSDVFVRNPLTLDGVMKPWHDMTLSIITSGGLPPDPSELLASEKLKTILAEMKGQADVVILDTPPITTVTDATLLAAQTDAVILVVESKGTRIGMATHALEQIKRANARLIGLVFNKINVKNSDYYSSYYSYHNENQDEGATKPVINLRKKNNSH